VEPEGAEVAHGAHRGGLCVGVRAPAHARSAAAAAARRIAPAAPMAGPGPGEICSARPP
jgi:hypothetical protein